MKSSALDQPIAQDEVFRVPKSEIGNHMVEVSPGVWLGDRFACADRELLHAKGVSAVINCSAAPPDKDADWARVAAKFGFVVPCYHTEPEGDHPGLRYMVVPVKDEAAEPISDYFDEAADFIEEALGEKESVLVHCEAGRSRSATVVMAFLMRRDHCSLSEALSKVKLHRAVFPNDGFVAQLHRYGDKIGVKGAKDDYTSNESEEAAGKPVDEVVEKNMKVCLWRLQQGLWYTTPAKELQLLQETGFGLEDCVSLGLLVVLDQDENSRNAMKELFQEAFSSGEMTSSKLCDSLRQYLLEDPDETEFPMLQDILLDVPFAEHHVGVVLHDADRASLLTADFLDFVEKKYPKVRENMVEEVCPST